MLLSQQDHERVRAAVEAAEARTSGEIVCVLARECSDYWEVPLAWAIGVALVVPAAALVLGLRPAMIGALTGGWTAVHAAAADAAVGQALLTYVVLQAALFVVTALVVSIRPVRRALTPTPLQRERVHRRAMEQFMSRAYHLTPGDTGVLVFASLVERQAIVIADEGVASKVGSDAWSGVVSALTAGMKANDPARGFADAIGKAADILTVHCPRQAGDANLLPDTVIELDL